MLSEETKKKIKFYGCCFIGFVLCVTAAWLIYDFVTKKKAFSISNYTYQRNDSNERYELYPSNKNVKDFNPIFKATPLPPDITQVPQVPVITSRPLVQDVSSTFCTCGGLIHESCRSPTDRVNSYNSGFTESSKFPNKQWSKNMPYDQFIDQQNPEQQNTGWFDVMPYEFKFQK